MGNKSDKIWVTYFENERKRQNSPIQKILNIKAQIRGNAHF